MSVVLTEDVTLKCAAGPTGAHGGTLGVSGNSRLRVDGKLVLTKSAITAGTITLCGNTNANAGEIVCTKASGPSAASKLKIDGNPVVLDNISATTNGTPPGKLAVTGTVHNRLKAV